MRGQANLLDDVTALEDLERCASCFRRWKPRKPSLRLLDLTQSAEGVQIFIGADNKLFGNAGCSMIVAPFANAAEHIVGAIGVIGPTRMNYARIMPMVDYTSRVVGRLIG